MLPPPPPPPPAPTPQSSSSTRLPFQCPAGVDSATFFRKRRAKLGTLISTRNCKGHHSLKTVHSVLEGTNVHDAKEERCADIFWYGHSQKRLKLRLNQQNISKLSPEQRVNWVPSITAMTNKGNFALAYEKLFARRPTTLPFSPAQWVLPEQSKEFDKHLADTGAEKRIFVVKPSIGSRSAGIELIQGQNVGEAIRSGALCSDFDRRKMMLMGRKEQYVAQEYLSKLLLLKGHKFDLRLYVVVTSLYPLKVYLFGDGLARVCVSPYTPPEESFKADDKSDAGKGDKSEMKLTKKKLFADWKLSQLTNSSVNKKSPDYDYDAHKLTARPTLLQCLKDRFTAKVAASDTNAVAAKAATSDTNAVAAKAAASDTNAAAAKAATGDTTAAKAAASDTNDVTTKVASGDTNAVAAASSSSAPAAAAPVDVMAENTLLWQRIDRVVWDTMVCIRPHLLSSYHSKMYAHGGKDTPYYQSKKASGGGKTTPGLDFDLDKCKPLLQSKGFDCPCFQVIGFDVIVDDALQPWLLEINSDPSLSVSELSTADASIKKNVVKHCLLMVSALQTGRDPDTSEVGGYRVLHDSHSDPLYDEHSKDV